MKVNFLITFVLFAQLLSAQTFSEVLPTTILPFEGVGSGSIAFSDVDGDNDQDVLITGVNDSTRIAKLYTNDGMGIYTEVEGTPFEGVGSGSIAFSDVDGDNDQDVLITGTNNAGTPIAKLYTNDGLGTYTEVVGTPFEGVGWGSIAFTNVDRDNDQDVLITGVNGSTPIAKLYTNDGMGTYTEVVGAPFEGVGWSSIAFSDVDGDNDQDVLITGVNGSNPIAKLYTNDGMGAYTEVVGTPFEGAYSGSIAFSDVDGDNDQDVLITGVNGSTPIAKLYTNDGRGAYTEVVGTPFEGVYLGSIAFSDVDGDNDQDVLITGRKTIGLFNQISKLYTNDGMGNYTKVVGTPFEGVYLSSIAFSDVDSDNDPDVLITGVNILNDRIAKIYNNDGMGNYADVAGAPFEGVEWGSVAFSDIDGDNDQDLLITGLNFITDRIAKLYTNDGMGTYTKVVGTPFEGVEKSSIAFSDVDGDNDRDVLITGLNRFDERIAKLYTNDGMGAYTQAVGTPFEGVDKSSIAFSDVDGDNDPDVLITGDKGSFMGIAKLYTNDGMGNYSQLVGTPFEGVHSGSIAFSDVDGDNDQDVLIIGDKGSFMGIAKLYTNDGMGNFTEVMGTSFQGVYSGSVAFSDVDGDNDPDVLITGINGSTRIAKLYSNDGMGNFTEKTDTPFEGVWGISIAFSDVDGDNDPDVVITGTNGASLIAKLYTNDGMGNYTEAMGTPFEGVVFSSIAFSDIDGDKDEDILITGFDGSTGIARLYTNDRIGTPIDEIGLAQDNNILLYPNPSKNGEVYIDYPSDKNNILAISLISIEGRIFFQQYSPVRYGSNKITVSYPALPGGWYIIRLDDGIRSRYGKLVVE